MSATLHTLVARGAVSSMVLYHSDDSDIGFSVTFTEPARLCDAVAAILFGKPLAELTKYQSEETGIVTDQLRETDDIAFSDGWIKLCCGPREVSDFLMAKLLDAKREEQFADGRRGQEYMRATAAEAKYGMLCLMLTEALGDKVPAVLAAARGEAAP